MTDIERQIFKLEEELTQTEHRLDVQALDRIYADDIIFTGITGAICDNPAVMDDRSRPGE